MRRIEKDYNLIAAMDAGNQLNKYLAINMKKNELKNCLIDDTYPKLLDQKAKKKKGMLEKKEVIINLINKIEILIRRKKRKYYKKNKKRLQQPTT